MLVKKRIFVTAIILALSSMPSIASAQIYDDFQRLQSQDFNVQSKLTLKIPLGATNHRKTSNQPRLGLNIGLARGDFGSPVSHFDNRYQQEPLNLLDVGAYGFKRPSVQLVGQEIHGPTFNSLYADEPQDETEEAKKGSNTGVLVIAGLAVVAAGSALFYRELEDEFADCFDAINRPGECAD